MALAARFEGKLSVFSITCPYQDFSMKTLSAMTALVIVCLLSSQVKLLKGKMSGNVKFAESHLKTRIC
ncbi:MAG TPA: hypothetical protein VH797_02990 [Nitrososphaeraceae archaeon]|jgi:hypothetical protein